LRVHHNAQYEIRVYAQIMQEIMALWVPDAHEAFQDYRVGGAHISAQALEVLHKMLDNQPVDQESSGLSPREWKDFTAAFPLRPQHVKDTLSQE